MTGQPESCSLTEAGSSICLGHQKRTEGWWGREQISTLREWKCWVVKSSFNLLEERDSKHQRLDGEFRPTQMAKVVYIFSTGSKPPQKVMDFLLFNYSNELLKHFWTVCCRLTWTSCASHWDTCVMLRGRGSKGRWEQFLPLAIATRQTSFKPSSPLSLAGRRQLFPVRKPEPRAFFSPIQGL